MEGHPHLNSLVRDCECWEHNVSVVISDDRFPKEAILHIYCPSCSPGIRTDKSCMAKNEGWLLHYNPVLLKSDLTVCLTPDQWQKRSIQISLEKKVQPDAPSPEVPMADQAPGKK